MVAVRSQRSSTVSSSLHILHRQSFSTSLSAFPVQASSLQIPFEGAHQVSMPFVSHSYNHSYRQLRYSSGYQYQDKFKMNAEAKTGASYQQERRSLLFELSRDSQLMSLLQSSLAALVATTTLRQSTAWLVLYLPSSASPAASFACGMYTLDVLSCSPYS